ncbi:TetR/AcrR family transcriptional regulator [Phenylobacterium sp.]|uniref:TetR/AcrR family transcriptional regulator n=1 Tax=Phenylobacterium sp. TaxID=1871053 RepID=UPI0035B19373
MATETKLQPSQARAQDTFELIVETTGRLLEEVGFERLSTNMVCRRAGLTPPALYRYFPNKYAILRELGDRLMREQDEAVLEWIDAGGLEADTLEEAIESNRRLQERVNEITRRFPGNISIMRAMRAVPILRDLRIASRDMVADRLADAMASLYPNVPRERLRIATRLSTELGYAATEMVLEEPDREAAEVTEQVARALVFYYRNLE